MKLNDFHIGDEFVYIGIDNDELEYGARVKVINIYKHLGHIDVALARDSRDMKVDEQNLAFGFIDSLSTSCAYDEMWTFNLLRKEYDWEDL